MKNPAIFRPNGPLSRLDVMEGRLVGYRRLKRSPPATLLPVFINPAAPLDVLLYQRKTPADRIREFVGDHDLRLDHLIVSSEEVSPKTLHLGDFALHAYETARGAVIAEQADDFRDRLRALLSEEQSSSTPFAGLEIARFVSDGKAEIAFAKACAQSLMASSTKLARAWVDGANLSVEARKAAELVLKSGLSDPLAEEPRDLELDHNESDSAPGDEALSRFMFERYRDEQKRRRGGIRQRSADQVLSEIASAGRQEERIGLLLDALLSDPIRGPALLDRYQADRAAFATTFLRLTKEAVTSSWSEDQAANEIMVGKLIKKMYRLAYPQNRGLLMYYLSKHLSKYGALNRLLRYMLNSLRSIYVDEYRRDIVRLLDHR